MPWVIVRPQLVGYLFIAAVVPLARRLMQARNRELIRWWVVAFAGEMVWVNLHLFAVIGPVLLTVACLGLALQRRSGLPRVVAAAVVSVAASALTPYGPIAAAKAISVHDNVAGVAIEWRPAGFATFSQFTAVLALGLAVVAARSAWQRRDVAALPVLAVLAVGAAMACRMAPALAVVALPDAAAWFSVGKFRRRGVAGVGVVVALLGAGVFVTGLGRLGQLATGTDSAALVRRIPHGCHTLNDYELGGTLIFFRPDVRVSIDSRTDLYGRRRIDANAAWLASSSDAAIRALDARGVDCVIAPTSDALVRTLAGDAAWRKAGADAVRSLYVRR
jgi:hypothetical protein